ncbi:hypothetical protein BGZ97_010186, partial [Linnemannia gamsii]
MQRKDCNNNCCDNCHPEKDSAEINIADAEGHQDAEAKAVSKRAPRRTELEKATARQAIDDWRTAIWKRDFSSKRFFYPSPHYVMSDQVLQTLADKHAKVMADESIDSFLNWTPLKHEYLQELTDILQNINDAITEKQGNK